MNKLINDSHLAVIIATDNAFCPFGEWGSDDAEPLDAIIPVSWNRSAVYSKSINNTNDNANTSNNQKKSNVHENRKRTILC